MSSTVLRTSASTSTQALVVISPGDDHDAGLDQGFAGDAPARVGRQDRIEHRIGDLVGDLVRMAFGNRFGGKRETLAHDVKSLQVRGQNSAGTVRATQRA